MFVHEDLHVLASCVVSYLWADRQRFDRFKGSKVQWFKASKFIGNRLRMRNLFGNRLPRGTLSAKSDASSFPHPPSLSASLHANVAPSAAGVWISRCRSTIAYQLGKVRWLLHHVLACAVRSLKSVCLLKVHSYVCDVGACSYVATTPTPRTAAEWYVHAAAWDGHILAFAYVGGMYCLVPRLILPVFGGALGTTLGYAHSGWLALCARLIYANGWLLGARTARRVSMLWTFCKLDQLVNGLLQSSSF